MLSALLSPIPGSCISSDFVAVFILIHKIFPLDSYVLSWIYPDSISSVEEVFVYGISFSKVDEPYLKKVASVSSNAHWTLSYYGEVDMCKIREFIDKNNIENYNIIMLDDMVNRNQLRLQFIY
mgnify:CR=1 FL=1